MRMLLRNAVPILLAVAGIVFVVTLLSQIWMAADIVTGIRSGAYEGENPSLIHILAAFSAALFNASLPFFGACIIDRLDRWFEQRGPRS